MLNKLSIKYRMSLYIILTVIVFAVVSYLSQLTLKQESQALKQISSDLKTVSASNDFNYLVYKEYTQLILDINMGVTDWNEGSDITENSIQSIEQIFSKFNESLPSEFNQSQEGKELFAAQDHLINSYLTLKRFFSKNINNVNIEELNKFAKTQMQQSTDNVVSKMNLITGDKFVHIKSLDQKTTNLNKSILNKILIALALGALISVLFGIIVMQSVIKPTNNLRNTIKRLSEGEYDVRSEVIGTDEIADLSIAFNGLLDDRSVTHSNINSDHHKLNQSVHSLLKTVAELSERNLTIRASVTEDATGPIADALNSLTAETAETLKDVKRIAVSVNQASNKVNTHLMSINKLAMKEQSRAIDTAEQMNGMIERLDSISNSAADTNTMAGTATTSTKLAQQSVTDTLTGMSEIRNTVQETGKRIKQLGERSQEISHVIEIIETIAERTTLLALNASMQAAAAGNEGKGFSVIAEEIQRLAQSSRESTGHISDLVSNIQQETNSTIETMDKTIEQVVDGSVRAADAADQMKNVLSTTNELVSAVDQIANASKDQVTISKDLKHKAESILKSTQVTGQELLSLTGLSRNMSEYAQQLVSSVDVFKLGDEK